jgi:hypothetical protein
MDRSLRIQVTLIARLHRYYSRFWGLPEREAKRAREWGQRKSETGGWMPYIRWRLSQGGENRKGPIHPNGTLYVVEWCSCHDTPVKEDGETWGWGEWETM